MYDVRTPLTHFNLSRPEPAVAATSRRISGQFRFVLAVLAASLVAMLASHPVLAGSQDTRSHGQESTDHVWSHVVDTTAIPIGDGQVSSAPKVGYVFACNSNFRRATRRHIGPWFNAQSGTWNAQAKAVVRGEKFWPLADYAENLSGQTRALMFNDLPVNDPTGTFPIATDDPAYQYDTNPNRISAHENVYKLPLEPELATSASCLPRGAIGVFTNGVLLFNALDDAGLDAVAHETQDKCNGHPNGREQYHYHNVSACIVAGVSAGSSKLVGYALDGFGIYVERDRNGNLPANADLDACHGRTSVVEWNGSKTSIYHYSATLEYPYTVGCFRGTPVIENTAPERPRRPRQHAGHR